MPIKNIPRLKGTYFSEKEKEQVRLNNKLIFISLMTDPLCNLKCLDCYVGEKKLSGKELTLDERIDVLKQAKNLGARTLRIAGEGEPLLDKEFFSLVEYATDQLNLDVFFFTNGTLISEEIASKLYENPRISLATKFSASPTIMEILTGNKGHFTRNKFIEYDSLLIPKTLKLLIDKRFNKLDKDGNSRLGIEFLLRKPNYGYVFDIFRWARRNEIVPYIEQNLEAGFALDWNDYKYERVNDKDAFFLSKRLLEIDKKEFGYNWTPSIPYLVGGICETEKSGCKKFTYNIVISSTGEAYPCYVTLIPLGNVKEKSLKEILDHPHRKELISNPQYNCLCRVFNRTSKEKGVVSSPRDLDKKFDYKSNY